MIDTKKSARKPVPTTNSQLSPQVNEWLLEWAADRRELAAAESRANEYHDMIAPLEERAAEAERERDEARDIADRTHIMNKAMAKAADSEKADRVEMRRLLDTERSARLAAEASCAAMRGFLQDLRAQVVRIIDTYADRPWAVPGVVLDLISKLDEYNARALATLDSP